MKYNIISKIFTGASLTLVVGNNGKAVTKTANSNHANWKSVLAAYKDKDYDKVVDFIDVRGTIQSNSKGRFTISGDQVYFNGEPVFGFLFNKILEYLKEGLEFEHLLKFADNLWANPSYTARTELYEWLQDRDYTIDDEGFVLGWKGVRDDYYSVHGNPQVNLISGITDASGRVYNGVGEAIEMKREDVNDSRKDCAHVGLHIGSRSFATSFCNDRLMVVRFNPKDCVSVPQDENCQKLRVCKYEVVAEEPRLTNNTDEKASNAYSKPMPKRDSNGRFCK